MLYSVLNISSFQELRNVGDKLERAGSNARNCRGTLQSFRSSVLLDPNFYRWRRIRQVLLHIQPQSMLLPEKRGAKAENGWSGIVLTAVWEMTVTRTKTFAFPGFKIFVTSEQGLHPGTMKVSKGFEGCASA